jgi:outer membrane protein
MKAASFASIIAAAICSAAACTAAAQPKPAPALPPPIVGFVDTQRVLRDSRTSRQVQQSLEAELQKRLKEIEAGPKDEIERRKVALADDLNVKREVALKRIIDRINEIIPRIARTEKLDAVFVEAIYVDVRIDITERVIRELDAGR